MGLFAWAAVAAAPVHGVAHHGDVDLAYEIRGAGSGAPLVVLNGGPGFSHDYLLLTGAWDELAVGRSVVFYDQRGTGRSTPYAAGDAYGLVDQVEDLEAVREALGVDRIDVLGHSFGGYLGLAYAIAHPEHVDQLVLCGAPPPKFADTTFLFDTLFPDVMAHAHTLEADPSTAARAVLEMIGTMFVSAPVRDDFLARLDPASYSPDVNAAVIEAIDPVDLSDGAARLAVPTLVLSGRFDSDIAPSNAWALHEQIPGSSIHFFEHSGHLPFVEEPGDFVATVEAFLSE